MTREIQVDKILSVPNGDKCVCSHGVRNETHGYTHSSPLGGGKIPGWLISLYPSDSSPTT